MHPDGSGNTNDWGDDPQAWGGEIEEWGGEREPWGGETLAWGTDAGSAADGCPAAVLRHRKLVTVTNFRSRLHIQGAPTLAQVRRTHDAGNAGNIALSSTLSIFPEWKSRVT
jgi:hypothetical protein